jgi:hypothetical protein
MELFLPGLFVLLISSLFVFLVVPNVGSISLGVICAVTLVAVLWHHSHLFKDEYRLSTWQAQLSTYAPFIVLGVAILVIIGVMLNMISQKGVMETIKAPVEVLTNTVQNSVSNMPSASTATNVVTSNINKAINSSPKSLIPALGYKASNV